MVNKVWSPDSGVFVRTHLARIQSSGSQKCAFSPMTTKANTVFAKPLKSLEHGCRSLMLMLHLNDLLRLNRCCGGSSRLMFSMLEIDDTRQSRRLNRVHWVPHARNLKYQCRVVDCHVKYTRCLRSVGSNVFQVADLEKQLTERCMHAWRLQ